MFLAQIEQLLFISLLIQFNFRTDLEILQGEKETIFFLQELYCYCMLTVMLQVKHITFNSESKIIHTNFAAHATGCHCNILISTLMQHQNWRQYSVKQLFNLPLHRIEYGLILYHFYLQFLAFATFWYLTCSAKL